MPRQVRGEVATVRLDLARRNSASASTPERSSVWPDLPRRREHRKKAGPGENGVVCGRRFCSVCGRWRHIVDFGPAQRTLRGTVITWQYSCQTCQRVCARLKNGHQPRRYGKITLEERRRRDNENWARRMEDPAYAAWWREYHRIYKAGQRRRAGVPERPVGPRSQRVVGPDSRWGSVDARPFLEWVARWQASGDDSIEELARRAGTDASRVREMKRAENPRVSLGFVDRFLIAAGGDTMLSHLYPEH